MPPKKITAEVEESVLVKVKVLGRLDHDGEPYDLGDTLEMDFALAKPLEDAGVVEIGAAARKAAVATAPSA